MLLNVRACTCLYAACMLYARYIYAAAGQRDGERVQHLLHRKPKM